MSVPAESPPESGLSSAHASRARGSRRSSPGTPLVSRDGLIGTLDQPKAFRSCVCVQRHLDKDTIVAASPQLHDIQGSAVCGAVVSVLTSRTRHLKEAAQNARELYAAFQ